MLPVNDITDPKKIYVFKSNIHQNVTIHQSFYSSANSSDTVWNLIYKF